MCGRFIRTTPPSVLASLFAADPPGAEPAPSGDLTPGQAVLIVRFNPSRGRRALDPARWGLIPHWSKTEVPPGRLFNARAETLAERAAFRDPFQRRRCLIPADAFFEAGQVCFRRRDGGPLALAGVWDNWRDPLGRWRRSVTLITTAATVPVALFHARMPVSLPPEDWPAWLGETVVPAGILARLLAPRTEPALEVRGDPPCQARFDLDPP